MAGNSLALTWDLIARDGASPVFDRVSAAADKTAASTEAASAKTAASFSTMAKVGAAAGLAFAAASVKMAADFQKQMTLVQTQAGASAAEVKKMTPAILSLSGKVAQAPEELATSLYHVESTGLRGAQALNAVKIAAEGARVGNANLEETTNALTATIASGMLPATETYAQAMGQLNTIVGSGDMKLEDLNQALGTGVLVTTKQYGVTLNDVGAALADFGDNNIRGADAATSLRMAVQSIAKPGKDAAGALGKIGLTVEQLQSDEQTGGLNKALTDLHTHLVNSGIASTQWGQLMVDAFTKKAGGGITTLIGTYDRFEQKYKEVQKGAGSFGDAWAATEKTAAFQAAALKDNIGSMTISIGDHLLPVATGAMSFVNHDAIPALQHLGSGAADVAHWFGEVPAPIRDTALALGGLALANAIGLTGRLSSGLGLLRGAAVSVKDGFVGLGDEFRIQQQLGAMQAQTQNDVTRALGLTSAAADAEAASLTRVQMMLRGYDVALAETTVEEEGATVGAEGFSAGLATLAARGGAAATSAIGGLTKMIGGPLGAAMLAGTIAFMSFQDSEQKATDQTSKWVDALKKGGTAATQAAAEMRQASASLNNANGLTKWSANFLGSSNAIIGSLEQMEPGIGAFSNKLRENQVAAENASKAYKDYLKSLSPGDRVQQKVTDSQQALTDAVAKYGPKSAQAKAAAEDYTAAQSKAKTVSDGVAQAIAAAGDASTAAAPKLEFAGSAAGMSADQVKNANKEWETWIKNLSGLATAFADPLQTYEDLLSKKQQAEQQSAESTAKATKSGKDSWQDYAQNVSVSLGEYAKQLETQLTNEQNWKENLVKIAQRGGVEVAQQFADMGVQGADLTAQMANATAANFSRMATDMANEAYQGGSQAAANLDEQMRIMAEIGKEGGSATANAVATALGVGINDVAAVAHQYGVTLASGLEPILQGLGKPPIVVPGYVTRPGLIGRNADGGLITGPGTGTSDSILRFLSNGEFVVNAAATAANRPLLEAINSVGRMAGGGFVSPSDVPHPYSTAPFGPLVASPSDGTMQVEYGDVTSWLNANALVGGKTSIPGNRAAVAAIVQAMAAARGWGSGAEWQALVNVINHESGFNPNAANPTSSARGLFQKMTSIYGPVEGTVQGQTNWGLNYIGGRYGDPLGAWRHEQQFGWYGKGTNYVPSDQLAVLHKGEAVVPADKNQGAPYSGGSTVNGMVVHGNVEIRDTDAMFAKANRYAQMAAARFR